MSDVSSSQQQDECSNDCCACPPKLTYDSLCDLLSLSSVPIIRIKDKGSHAGPTDNDDMVVTPLEFYREFVAKSKPCIIRGLADDWSAITKWRDDAYLFQTEPQHYKNAGSRDAQPAAGPASVTVSLTPNGRADCITDVIFLQPGKDGSSVSVEVDAESERLFMAPAEVKVPFPTVLSLIQQARLNAVLVAPLSVDLCGSAARRKFRPRAIDPADLTPIPYCQTQNNCLETEFPWLKDDITSSVASFGEEVFGSPCDAANVWIGTSMSVTSMHQDWYENIYAVVRGVKQFTLIPPWEAPLLKKERVRSAKYCVKAVANGATEFEKHIEFEDEEIDWIGVDVEDSPEHDVMLRNPEILKTNPLQAEVTPGEALYLPAMWFHRVAQTEVPSDDTCVVAVNYWFDMCMDGPLYHLMKYVAANGATSSENNDE
jgi:hypothetical protein